MYNLIKFEQFFPFLTDLIECEKKIKNKVENLMMYFNDNFIKNSICLCLIDFDQFWKDLIQSDQKINKLKNLMINFNDSSEMQF